MTEFVNARINDRWELKLPAHREEFHRLRKTWEAGRLAHCVTRILPGTVVYDVGAEHGDFTALYQQWAGPQGIVVPFEPSPPYWPCIRETYEANAMEPPKAWWAGFAGHVTMIDPPDVDFDRTPWRGWPACAWGENSDTDIGKFRHLGQQQRSTPTVRLDAFADFSGVRPDVIVMDVEGAEYHVLEGCEYLFAEDRPLSVYVSLHVPTLAEWYGKTPVDITELMARYGFGETELPYYGEGETFLVYERNA